MQLFDKWVLFLLTRFAVMTVSVACFGIEWWWFLATSWPLTTTRSFCPTQRRNQQQCWVLPFIWVTFWGYFCISIYKKNRLSSSKFWLLVERNKHRFERKFVRRSCFNSQNLMRGRSPHTEGGGAPMYKTFFFIDQTSPNVL